MSNRRTLPTALQLEVPESPSERRKSALETVYQSAKRMEEEGVRESGVGWGGEEGQGVGNVPQSCVELPSCAAI